MHDVQKSTSIRCPKCHYVLEISGMSGEQKIITCEKCGLQGTFTFPESDFDPKKRVGSPSVYDIIVVQHLTKKYKDLVAVNNLSFNVKKGEIFGFLGPNGAGKTTTIRTLLGYLRANNGEAYIFGKNIKDNIVEIRKNVGYIPGELALYEQLTGRQFLNYFARIRNTDLSLLDELLEIFELPLDKKIKGYSKGMKQKIGIVQAFMDDPEIVIMDEPTSGLDPLLQQKFYDFLLREKQKGRTMFFSSHVLSEVEKICDRVGIIRNGNLIALESIENLKRKRGKRIRLKIKEKPDEIITKYNATMNRGWIDVPSIDNLDTFIKDMAHFTIIDLEIQETKLEDIFMKYYTSEGGN